MAHPPLHGLLDAWRTAEQRWDRSTNDADRAAAQQAVLEAWLAYNEASGSHGPDEIVLVVDESMICVAATGPTDSVLGRSASDLMGRTVFDLAAGEEQDRIGPAWEDLLRSGRLTGSLTLRGRDGSPVRTTFTARAHHPLPGLRVSRHRPR